MRIRNLRLPARPRAPGARGLLLALAGNLQGGCETEKAAARTVAAAVNGEHASRESHLANGAYLGTVSSRRMASSPGRVQQPSRESEEEAFGEELAKDTSAARADGDADAYFVLARYGAREHQAAEVGACDGKDEDVSTATMATMRYISGRMTCRWPPGEL